MTCSSPRYTTTSIKLYSIHHSILNCFSLPDFVSFLQFFSQFINVSFVSILTNSATAFRRLCTGLSQSINIPQFTSIVLKFSTNLFHLPQNVHDFFESFCTVYLSYYKDCICHTKSSKFSSSNGMMLLLRFDSSLEFNIHHRFHNLQHFQHLQNTRSQNWILSENKSRQKWAHQSETFCIYFLGFISLICYGDLHCFNSFIICNWLAISSGYISSVN